jgi:hypothetical protein
MCFDDAFFEQIWRIWKSSRILFWAIFDLTFTRFKRILGISSLQFCQQLLHSPRALKILAPRFPVSSRLLKLATVKTLTSLAVKLSRKVQILLWKRLPLRSPRAMRNLCLVPPKTTGNHIYRAHDLLPGCSETMVS